MAFAGINYLAVLIAAVASWLVGAVWYMALAKPWLAAIGITAEQIHERRKGPGAFLPFVYALLANVIIAWVLGGLLGHLGQLTLRNGALSGLFCWGGFVFPTMLVNNRFAMRSPKLLLIDGGYWLVVLVLSGAIIGALGV
jgi:Protein of unknown function (DUF1761)